MWQHLPALNRISSIYGDVEGLKSEPPELQAEYHVIFWIIEVCQFSKFSIFFFFFFFFTIKELNEPFWEALSEAEISYQASKVVVKSGQMWGMIL